MHLETAYGNIPAQALTDCKISKNSFQKGCLETYLVGGSPSMQELRRIVEKASRTEFPVLITGETGTGKELIARALHWLGNRSGRPFVPVNCAALVPTLIESELFGFVRGSFTGAQRSRNGLLSEALDGTFFFDEIADLPIEAQSKLLRLLEEREFRPVGAASTVAFRARIIAATNRHLEEALKRGTFRDDLYFRLNAINIAAPPLRERKSDIPALAQSILQRISHSQRIGEHPRILSTEAVTTLMQYGWPGNVRELVNALEYAVTFGSESHIQLGDLPRSVTDSRDPTSRIESEYAGSTIAEVARRATEGALRTTGGNILMASRLLGIGKTTLYRKIRKYGIDRKSDS